MTVSLKTIDAVYRAVRKHVTDKAMEKIIDDLLQIPGNKAFREVIVQLATLDARTERPPPVDKCYIGYRYRGPFGWIPIGAMSDSEAFKEATRSLTSGAPDIERLERWDGKHYVPVTGGQR